MGEVAHAQGRVMNSSTKRHRRLFLLVLGLVGALLATLASPASASSVSSHVTTNNAVMSTGYIKVTNIAGLTVYIDDRDSSGYTNTQKVAAYNTTGVTIKDLDAIRVAKPWYASYSRYAMIVWVNGKRYDENDGYFNADPVVPPGATVKVAAFLKSQL